MGASLLAVAKSIYYLHDTERIADRIPSSSAHKPDIQRGTLISTDLERYT